MTNIGSNSLMNRDGRRFFAGEGVELTGREFSVIELTQFHHPTEVTSFLAPGLYFSPLSL
jgi:hypothetical protein